MTSNDYLTHTVMFSRKLSDGNYGGNEATLFIQFDTPLGDDVDHIIEEANHRFAMAKGAVLEQLGISYEVVEAEDDTFSVVELGSLPKASRTSHEVREIQAKAKKVIADAEEKKLGEVVKRSMLTEVSNGVEADLDLSGYNTGDNITLEGDIPLGYKLGNSERVMQVHGYRTVYEIANGEKILSVNELQKGVIPKPNSEINSGIFCQESGEEVTADDSNLSRIRFRKIFSSDIFDEEVQKLKR